MLNTKGWTEPPQETMTTRIVRTIRRAWNTFLGVSCKPEQERHITEAIPPGKWQKVPFKLRLAWPNTLPPAQVSYPQYADRGWIDEWAADIDTEAGLDCSDMDCSGHHGFIIDNDAQHDWATLVMARRCAVCFRTPASLDRDVGSLEARLDTYSATFLSIVLAFSLSVILYAAVLFIIIRQFLRSRSKQGISKKTATKLGRIYKEIMNPLQDINMQGISDINLDIILPGRQVHARKRRVSWACTCGKSFSEWVTETEPGAAVSLQPFSGEHAGIDLESQITPDSGGSQGSAQATSTTSGSVDANSSQRRRFPKLKERFSLGDDPNDTDENSRRRILLCVPGRGGEELKPACVTASLTDRNMYMRLNQALYSFKQAIWYWATLRSFVGIDFVEFHLYWRRNISILDDGLGKLPPVEASEYICSRVTDPPVLLTALHHFIQHPSHAPPGAKYLERMPKKLGLVPFVSGDGSPVIGYGLRIIEAISWTKVLVIEGLLALAALLFAIVWCKRNSGDLQDGFTVAGVILAYGTLLIACVQSIAHQRTIAARFA